MNNYFSHDSNARNSAKLIPVRTRHGVVGYGVYFMILERLRDESNYMSIKDYNMIAFDLRVDSSIVRSIIEDFGLFVFTDDGKYFYSESFMKRMGKKDEISKKRSITGKLGSEKRWHDKKMAIAINDNGNCYKNRWQKEDFAIENYSKESKVKESKETPTPNVVGGKKAAANAAPPTRQQDFYESLVPFVEKYGKDMIRNFFSYWSEPNKSGTKMRFELERTWDVGRRLGTWANNELKFSKHGNNQKNDPKRGCSDEELAEAIRQGIGRGRAILAAKAGSEQE